MEEWNIKNFKVYIVIGALLEWYIPEQSIICFGGTFLFGETVILSEEDWW